MSHTQAPRPPHAATCRAGLLPASLLALACTLPALAQTTATTTAPPLDIQPLTTVTVQPPSGYFADPYPIHLSDIIRPIAPQFFSGTTKQILACPEPIHADCIDVAPVSVTTSPIQTLASRFGSTVGVVDNTNIYQDHDGAWQMAATIYITNPAFPDFGPWTVIVHAHPADPILPTAWIADALLAGSLSEPAKANYDGKFFEDDRQLYLIYSKNLLSSPVHDGIVAQRLSSWTEPADELPTTLLQPLVADGGYNSELFFGLNQPSTFKLVETGNITKIHGKYAMAYSTGGFNQRGYKAGVAWSDTFLPAPGTFYKKVLMLDTAGVFGQPDHQEVRYLLQSQEPNWPNFVAAQVIAPGVPSIVKDHTGTWNLFFAGYAPTDDPTDPATGFFIPSHRRPYLVPLEVRIPADTTVTATPNADLATWIQPRTR